MQYLKLIFRPRLLLRLLFVVGITALLVPFPASAAEVPADTNNATDSRCVVHVVNANDLRFNCYFDPVNSRNDGQVRARPSIMTAAGAGHVGISTWQNNNTSGSGFRFLNIAVGGGALYGPTQVRGFGFGAAAGLPAGAISFEARWSSPHGITTATNLTTVYTRPIYSGITCSSGSICQNLRANEINDDIVVVNDPGGAGYWPVDWFPSGASAGSPPAAPNRCGDVKIALEVDNSALTVADYDDTVFPANGSATSDDYVWLVTFEDFNVDAVNLGAADGLDLRYRWPGNANWSPILEVLDTVPLNGGTDSAMTFRVGSSVQRFVSQIQWQCHDRAEGEENPAKRWLPFWDPGSSVNDPAWQTSTAYANPCSAIVIGGAPGSVSPGAVGRVSYSLPTSTGLDLEVFAYGVSAFSPSTDPPIVVASTSALGAATGGPPPFDNGVAPGSGFLTFTLPAAVANPVPYGDLVWACTDATVSGVIVPGSADLGLIGSFDPTANQTCWTHAGMSLTSPASWITGVAKMLSCIAQDLFVPDEVALFDQVQDMNATVAERPPFIAVAAIVGFAGDLSDSFSATSGSGCFTGPSIPGVSASTSSCAGAGIDLEPGQRSTMALLLTAPMILGLAGHMFGLLRGQSEFITEDNGQMAWRM
jgi:hypothetical protein